MGAPARTVDVDRRTGDISVVIAEDSLLVRQGILRLLEDELSVVVVASAGSYDEAVEAISTHSPDVVLTDIRMPPTGTDEGVRLARALRLTRPNVGVVVLSQYVEPEYALAVLDEGANGRGYLVKDSLDEPSKLVAAITSVAGGGSFVDTVVVEALVSARRQGSDPSLAALTDREREILGAIATGLTNAAVATRHFVSERAVEKHVSSIFAKLGLADAADMNRRVAAVLLYLADN